MEKFMFAVSDQNFHFYIAFNPKINLKTLFPDHFVASQKPLSLARPWKGSSIPQKSSFLLWERFDVCFHASTNLSHQTLIHINKHEHLHPLGADRWHPWHGRCKDHLTSPMAEALVKSRQLYWASPPDGPSLLAGGEFWYLVAPLQYHTSTPCGGIGSNHVCKFSNKFHRIFALS